MIYKKYTNENYNLYTIKTDKFKSCLMEVVFSKPLDKSKVTMDNFLVENLGYTCKKYPKRKNMVEKLEDLYAASCYSVTTRVGNVLFSNFILEFLDPKYCDKNYIKQSSNFILKNRDLGYSILRFYKHIYKLINPNTKIVRKLEQLVLGIPISLIVLILSLFKYLKEQHKWN